MCLTAHLAPLNPMAASTRARFLSWPELIAFLKHNIEQAKSKGDLQVAMVSVCGLQARENGEQIEHQR